MKKILNITILFLVGLILLPSVVNAVVVDGKKYTINNFTTTPELNMYGGFEKSNYFYGIKDNSSTPEYYKINLDGTTESILESGLEIPEINRCTITTKNFESKLILAKSCNGITTNIEENNKYEEIDAYIYKNNGNLRLYLINNVVPETDYASEYYGGIINNNGEWIIPLTLHKTFGFGSDYIYSIEYNTDGTLKELITYTLEGTVVSTFNSTLTEIFTGKWDYFYTATINNVSYFLAVSDIDNSVFLFDSTGKKTDISMENYEFDDQYSFLSNNNNILIIDFYNLTDGSLYKNKIINLDLNITKVLNGYVMEGYNADMDKELNLGLLIEHNDDSVALYDYKLNKILDIPISESNYDIDFVYYPLTGINGTYIVRKTIYGRSSSTYQLLKVVIEDAKKVNVKGILLDENNNKLANTKVILNDGTPVITDENGNFEFNNVYEEINSLSFKNANDEILANGEMRLNPKDATALTDGIVEFKTGDNNSIVLTVKLNGDNVELVSVTDYVAPVIPNPNTNDNITLYFITAIITIMSLCTISLLNKKHN